MKLIILGNSSLISSASVEEQTHSIQLIVNCRQRWPQWHYVSTSIELDPGLDQCAAFDFFPVRQHSEEELAEKATLVIVAESDRDKEMFCLAGSMFSSLDKDQLVCAWLKQDDSPVITLAEYK